MLCCNKNKSIVNTLYIAWAQANLQQAHARERHRRGGGQGAGGTNVKSDRFHDKQFTGDSCTENRIN